VLISWFILSTFGYLFYKLSKEKSRNNEKIHFYTPGVLLNPIVQEKSDQDMNRWKKSKNKSNLQNFGLQLSFLPSTTYSALATITGPLACLTKTCRYGDKILPGKISPEQQTVAMEGMKFQNPCFPRSYVAMATNVLPGEKRRFGASGWWRGRNPLAKKVHVALATKSCLAEKHFSAEV